MTWRARDFLVRDFPSVGPGAVAAVKEAFSGVAARIAHAVSDVRKAAVFRHARLDLVARLQKVSFFDIEFLAKFCKVVPHLGKAVFHEIRETVPKRGGRS